MTERLGGASAKEVYVAQVTQTLGFATLDAAVPDVVGVSADEKLGLLEVRRQLGVEGGGGDGGADFLEWFCGVAQ